MFSFSEFLSPFPLHPHTFHLNILSKELQIHLSLEYFEQASTKRRNEDGFEALEGETICYALVLLWVFEFQK